MTLIHSMIKTVVFLSVLILTACSSQSTSIVQSDQEFKSKEALLENTNDNNKLIALYKKELLVNDSYELRLKLVNTYLEVGDIDSADFHLERMSAPGDQSAELDYLKARVKFEQDDPQQALIYGKRSLEKRNEFAEVENLLGLVYVRLGKFENAREHFLKARELLYEDVVISNNLAVMDILESDYQRAITRLEPVYKNGQADKQVVSNLVLAYAKVGDFVQVKSLLGGMYSAEEVHQIYTGLKHVSLNDSVKTQL